MLLLNSERVRAHAVPLAFSFKHIYNSDSQPLFLGSLVCNVKVYYVKLAKFTWYIYKLFILIINYFFYQKELKKKVYGV